VVPEMAGHKRKAGHETVINPGQGFSGAKGGQRESINLFIWQRAMAAAG